MSHLLSYFIRHGDLPRYAIPRPRGRARRVTVLIATSLGGLAMAVLNSGCEEKITTTVKTTQPSGSGRAEPVVGAENAEEVIAKRQQMVDTIRNNPNIPQEKKDQILKRLGTK